MGAGSFVQPRLVELAILSLLLLALLGGCAASGQTTGGDETTGMAKRLGASKPALVLKPLVVLKNRPPVLG